MAAFCHANTEPTLRWDITVDEVLTVQPLIAGMSARDFRGIPSVQEVECTGGALEAEVHLLTLKLFRVADDVMLASLNHFTGDCVTSGEFSSCVLDRVDTKRSRLRTLVADLDEEETRRYGCVVGVLRNTDLAKFTWTVDVKRNSKISEKCF